MKRSAFTMIELIMTIVIMGILAAGAYVSVSKLFYKSSKTKAISDLSLESTLVSTQITGLLKNRIPSTVIGYDSANANFESIYTITSSYPILEWIGVDYDSLKRGDYSGFVDFDKCDKSQNLIYSPSSDVNATNRALIFAGAFDEGSIVYDEADFNASFGWHSNSAKKIFDLNQTTSSGKNIYLSTTPEVIYEKYSLVKSAFAIARYNDVKSDAVCISDLNLSNKLGEKTLFLFYDFKPWKGESFCADPNALQQSGKVTILSNEASGFEVDFVNGNLQFNLSLSKIVRKPGKDLNITISKQKVVF